MRPGGVLGPEDAGELELALVANYALGIVRIEFGGPVAWIGLPPEAARQLAHHLVELAESVERGHTRREGDANG